MSTVGYGISALVTPEENDYMGYLNQTIDNIRSANDFNRVARKVIFVLLVSSKYVSGEYLTPDGDKL